MAAARGVLAVRLLGPLEVLTGGQPVELQTGRLRALLATLAVSAGTPVSVDRLAAAFWDDAPPSNARRSIQTYVARLRVTIGADTISWGPAGYLLSTDPEQVDVLRFGQLLDAAAHAPDRQAERSLLDQALALWRGSPFGGVRSAWLERAIAPRLHERYLGAVERRVDLDLAEGRHGELVPQLHELTGLHPLRESLWVRLLALLDRSGRQAEALERYEQIRIRLAEELGTDPGPELRQAHADLLAGAPPRRAGEAAPALTGPPVPRQLPADIDGFTGRLPELKALTDLTGAGQDLATGTMVIATIAGTAGIGKTALAVHWAHQVAGSFPDGQLYVNLRGFHPSGSAMEPADAIRGFLDALDVSPHRVPPDLDSKASLYRSLLAGKRMLVVLDNARDAEQVRPLLPGTRTCLVIVTSRNQLTSLVATEGARPLQLGFFAAEQAENLLTHRLGCDRVAAEPAAVREIVAGCAGLPLALAIVAGRAAIQPQFPLQTFATELRDARSTLDAIDAGDTPTDIRAVFSWSYQALSAAAARLFRLLGLHPGPEMSMPGAASLAGVPEPAVRPMLAALTRANLLAEPRPGRYACHDLLRSYATELTLGLDPHADRQAALGRLLDHYLHTAYAAAMLLHPQRNAMEQRSPVKLATPEPEVTPEPVADTEQALAWFTTEHPGLVAAVQCASAAGLDLHAWQLAWCLAEYLDRQGHWRDLAATQRAALAATQRLGDRSNTARTHRHLAAAHSWLGEYQDANTHLRCALEIYEDLDDPAGLGLTHHVLSMVLEEQADYRAALHHAYRSLELSRQTGDKPGLARGLNAVGWQHARLGEYPPALAHCQQALELLQQEGDRYSQAHTWDSIGYAQHHLGHHRQAIASYQRAIELFQQTGDRYYLAQVLIHRGDARDDTGEPEPARADWQAALDILDALGHPDAARLRGRSPGRSTMLVQRG